MELVSYLPGTVCVSFTFTCDCTTRQLSITEFNTGVESERFDSRKESQSEVPKEKYNFKNQSSESIHIHITQLICSRHIQCIISETIRL
jgi:hypothetical protein